jgi:hypothetical protein
MLKGAAERARIEAELSGGYFGLLDPEEARRIGEKMQDFHEKWFTLFANVDVDRDGTINVAELSKALGMNDFLRNKLIENAKIETSPSETMETLAEKVLRAVDDDGDGKIEPRELERAIRGWTKFDWRATNTEESDRAHQLAGAAERAKIRRDEIGGGFAGITDAEEALQIGDAARGFNATERAQFADTEGAFADGAAFALNPELKAKRSEEEAVIKAELKEEGMLNKVGEDFKGLDADEALRVGENVKLGGELLEFDF